MENDTQKADFSFADAFGSSSDNGSHPLTNSTKAESLGAWGKTETLVGVKQEKPVVTSPPVDETPVMLVITKLSTKPNPPPPTTIGQLTPHDNSMSKPTPPTKKFKSMNCNRTRHPPQPVLCDSWSDDEEDIQDSVFNSTRQWDMSVLA